MGKGTVSLTNSYKFIKLEVYDWNFKLVGPKLRWCL